MKPQWALSTPQRLALAFVLSRKFPNVVVEQLGCHDGNLANGLRLSGTRPGTQEEPPLVNQGSGYF